MFEKMILSAAYFESFSEFKSRLNKKSYSVEEKKSIAQSTLNNFIKSASSSASKKEVDELGNKLYLHVLAELNDTNNVEDDKDLKDIESALLDSLLDDWV